MNHMNIDRSELVQRLALVDMGLSKRGSAEQSSCYVFRDGKVWTFNDEVVCSAALPSALSGVECAVPAEEFRGLLAKLGDGEIDVALEPGEHDDAAELVLSMGSCRAGIRVQVKTDLPVDEMKIPDRWSAVPDGFSEAVEAVQGCASKNDSALALSCLHITQSGLEASDGYQAIRYKLETGLKSPMLVRRDVLVDISKLGMTSWAVEGPWMFFANPSGLVVGCRLWEVDFPDLRPYFEVAGSKVVFPKSILSAVEKAEVFLDEKGGSDCVIVDLNSSRLLLRSEGPVGWFEEHQETSYDGEPLKFSIAPWLLREICSRSDDGLVGNNRLLVKSERFEYVSACRVS